MPDESDERGGGFDDLFEDLDKFFAPEDRAAARGKAAPSDAEAESPPAVGEQASGGKQGAAGEQGSAEERGPEEDILPADWLPDVEGLDLSEAEEPAAPTAGEEPAAPVPPPGHALEPTAEMNQQDWSRLRHVLGDDLSEGAGDEIGLPEGRGAAEGIFGYSDEGEDASFPEGEERHDLTLEDLKKAPPEYRHLPGPPDDEAAQDDRDAIRDERGTFLGEREGVRDDFTDVGERPLVPEAGGEERWQPSPADRQWEEAAASAGERWADPGIAEVEAAAEQMAEEFRTGLASEDELLADVKRPSQPRTVKVGQPESMLGPTWEEPGSQPLMGEPAAPMFAGRNMPMALLTAAVLAAAALISLAISRAAFAVVVVGVVLIGQAEVYAVMQRKGYQPATALGLVVGGLLMVAAYLKGEQAMLFFVPLALVLSFLWYAVAAPKAREGALGNIGATLLGLVWVPFLAGYIMLVLTQHSGRALALAILGLTFLYDAAAFVVGSFWGSRALAPTISPKKSWEGLFAATVVTFAVSIAVLPSIKPLTLGRSVGLALVIAVVAPLGDLFESFVKRDLGVKDMGSVLPGHGGIMDRIDSALFVLPAAFYFLRLIF